ncbi:MAG: hypothetical protein IT370_24880 [Deltaproteobacteria bacterium]|nr:hypothetical protein [Deltaproteobacteria bacterium]
MPGKRPGAKGAEHRLEAALAALADGLNEAGAPWMVIGGVAVIARGVRRMTTDVDAVVRGGAVSVAVLLRALARHQILPRIDDAAAFAASNLVVLLRHQPSGVDLDVSLGWTLFEHEAIESSTSARFGSIVVPMARAEELVVFKLVAARPKDVEDVVALLLTNPRLGIAGIRRRLVSLAESIDEPALVEALEAALKAARGPRGVGPRGKATTRPRRRR